MQKVHWQVSNVTLYKTTFLHSTERFPGHVNLTFPRRDKTCIILLRLTPDDFNLANVRGFYSSKGELLLRKSSRIV